ncbi:NAD(P)-binding protein [Artomyces pyxidatus]|uniref:NAD(P)-binding protein n=1 Tax=Artomyces pyxidatus TaxID=48021 RepID=A0ACB8TF16_9AGAM|nr:NAD(P)-binding protein [Artomyces pyxidatus]
MGSFFSRPHPDRDLLDLRGRVAIVTGASAGIGIYTVLHLVRRGAKVYLVGRDRASAIAAIERLRTEEDWGLNHGEILPMEMELTDPLGVKAAAEWFLQQETRLDILVNNAAKIPSPYNTTSEGISHSLLINIISPFLFTQTLFPLLEKTSQESGSDVRIVNVSSLAHRVAPKNPRYDSLETMNSSFSDKKSPELALYGSYLYHSFEIDAELTIVVIIAYTKLADILWTKELQRRFDSQNVPITAITCHPGSITTEGTMNQFKRLPMGNFIAWSFSFVLMTPDHGGYTPAYAAAAKVIAENPGKYKGQYLVPYGIIEEASDDARREDLAQELWRTTDITISNLGWA